MIALRDSIEIYAWAPKPYHKFMAFKVSGTVLFWGLINSLRVYVGLVIALRDSIEIYAWAPKPYHKFMAFKVSGDRIVLGLRVMLV